MAGVFQCNSAVNTYKTRRKQTFLLFLKEERGLEKVTSFLSSCTNLFFDSNRIVAIVLIYLLVPQVQAETLAADAFKLCQRLGHLFNGIDTFRQMESPKCCIHCKQQFSLYTTSLPRRNYLLQVMNEFDVITVCSDGCEVEERFVDILLQLQTRFCFTNALAFTVLGHTHACHLPTAFCADVNSF